MTKPLVNRNYLMIWAGNGSTAFDCPADDTSTSLVNGTTWRHEPAGDRARCAVPDGSFGPQVAFSLL